MRASDLLDLHSRPVRASRVDAWLRELYVDAGAPSTGMALVAVGGLGRGELAPASDLDLLLLHAGASPGGVPDRLWYPIWDGGFRLDHSVRSPRQARDLARSDLKVLLGLIDARTVAGDESLTRALRENALADWRADPARLGDLHALVAERREVRGDLGHLLEPDLKESYGGLRDLAVLTAIAASWLVDVPHGPVLSRSREVLLDCRDALHHATRRPLDVLRRQEQSGLAAVLGAASAEDLLREVLAAGRAIAHVSDQAWHRVNRRLTVPARSIRRMGARGSSGRRSPLALRTPLADGVVVQDGEAVLSLDARPEADPELLLRAGAAAAQAGLRLSDHALERLGRSAELAQPWPAAARDALASLLGAGPGLVPVWEDLDQAGLITRLIPEWEAVRSLPQGSPVHRFTVDRHLVETAAAASLQARAVARPDLLLLGALLHDIGKGRGGDHSVEGAAIAGGILRRLGLTADDREIVTALVRHHLLLAETAVRRNLSDPGTIEQVASAVGSLEVLELLAALTVADAAATGPAAWSEWKAGLVAELVRRTREVLSGSGAAHTGPASHGSLPPGQDLPLPDVLIGIHLREIPDLDGWHIEVLSPDRPGLLADIAGVMSLHRMEIRSADVASRASTPLGIADAASSPRVLRVSLRARPLFGDPPGVDRLREDLQRVGDGGMDLVAALAARAAAYPQRMIGAPPKVIVDERGSARATIIEVRAHDGPGLLHRLLRALAHEGVTVIAARMSTLGSEAVDAFYIVDELGHPVRGTALDAVVRALAAAALGDPVADG